VFVMLLTSGFLLFLALVWVSLAWMGQSSWFVGALEVLRVWNVTAVFSDRYSATVALIVPCFVLVEKVRFWDG
jgi:hypothetical protein